MLRWVSRSLAVAVVFLLAALALRPGMRERMPPALRWFGQPGSSLTITIVVAIVVAAGALAVVGGRTGHAGTTTVRFVMTLTVANFVLGLSSYWNCHGAANPYFYTPLMWTIGLLKGGTGDQSISGTTCPTPTPIALEIARLSALAAILVGIGGVVIALLRSQADRIRVHTDKSVSAVVGVDDDARSMVNAVRNTLETTSRLVVITETPDIPAVQEARQQGARIVVVDFDRPETLESLPVWRKLDRLYLLSPDPVANLSRLEMINRCMSAIPARRRVPLIVRIDDPWQAEAWRARQFGGSDSRWAADAVGKYEVTARRLLEEVTADPTVTRIVVCGSSPLTLALCADIAQRHRERSYRANPEDAGLPTLTLVDDNAEEYLRDHEFHENQLGLGASRPDIAVVLQRPSVPVLTDLVDADADSQVVILVDSAAAAADTMMGTRLAARFPAMLIYAWDPNARHQEDRAPIVGRLRTFGLGMDLPAGMAQDSWERAARLIHERFADRFAAETGHRTPATLPWAVLDEFHRESNRRQVRNILWIVEAMGGHSWNSAAGQAAPPPESDMYQRSEPLETLRLLGFDADSAIAMARAEHQDWCRFYREAGWRYGPTRDDERRIHDKLLDWDAAEHTPSFKKTALQSLADTLLELAKLGYRSRPVWQRYRRAGTVVAQQQNDAWTWTSEAGNVMHGDAGDWAIHDGTGKTWSVRDGIFRATHQHVGGDRWRRTGFVRARPARAGENVDTLEGSATAADGDWIVAGEQGEQWPVPGEQFRKRYEGPLPW
ncbi:MAG: hypothetical protein KDB71_02040 [Mycobacterium sp.]|nr:hypothetical protein [Mycobacterium sp.]